MKIIRAQNGDIINPDYIKSYSLSALHSVIYATTNDNDRLILYQGSDAEQCYIDFWQTFKEKQKWYSFVTYRQSQR